MTDQERICAILSSAFVFMRMANPTLEDHRYGDAGQIFGSYHPADWNTTDVQALLNLNSLIADGLHNLPRVLLGDKLMNLDRYLLQFATALDTVLVPASVMRMPAWHQFGYLVAGRVLGVSL